jgi:hypothetical protein
MVSLSGDRNAPSRDCSDSQWVHCSVGVGV